MSHPARSYYVLDSHHRDLVQAIALIAREIDPGPTVTDHELVPAIIRVALEQRLACLAKTLGAVRAERAAAAETPLLFPGI